MLRALPLLLLPGQARSYPSYVTCRSDAATPLRVGAFSCGITNKTKGSTIAPGNGSVTVAASATTLTRGGSVRINVTTNDKGTWFAIRVSDAGSGGQLWADNASAFTAHCPTQLATAYGDAQTQPASAMFTYRAPCDAAVGATVRVTVVSSRCTPPCAPPIPLPPSPLELDEAALLVGGAPVDGGCASPAPTPPPPRAPGKVCAGSSCLNGECDGATLNNITKLPLNASKWDAQAKRYLPPRTLDAYVLQDLQWGAFAHGATFLRGGAAAAAPGIPPLYFSVDTDDTMYRIDDINLTALTFQSKPIARANTPNSQQHIYTDDGKVGAVIFTACNPYGVSQGKGEAQREISQGGVFALGPSGCHRLFPSAVDDAAYVPSGKPVQQVRCHAESGVCFFAVWEHDFPPAPVPGAPEPSGWTHCLHWCKLDDKANPTRCAAGGKLTGGPGAGGAFCDEARPHMNGTIVTSPHGILVQRAEARGGGAWHMTVLLAYLDGEGSTDVGESFMRKVTLTVLEGDAAGDGAAALTQGYEDWGNDLWQYTTTAPHTPKTDHFGGPDASGNVWVSTFGKENAAAHVLTADGELLVSYTGFQGVSPFADLYFNPSGVEVLGGYGTAGSYAAVPVESVIPLPTLHSAAILFPVDHEE